MTVVPSFQLFSIRCRCFSSSGMGNGYFFLYSFSALTRGHVRRSPYLLRMGISLSSTLDSFMKRGKHHTALTLFSLFLFVKSLFLCFCFRKETTYLVKRVLVDYLYLSTSPPTVVFLSSTELKKRNLLFFTIIRRVPLCPRVLEQCLLLFAPLFSFFIVPLPCLFSAKYKVYKRVFGCPPLFFLFFFLYIHEKTTTVEAVLETIGRWLQLHAFLSPFHSLSAYADGVTCASRSMKSVRCDAVQRFSPGRRAVRDTHIRLFWDSVAGASWRKQRECNESKLLFFFFS